MVTYCFPFLIIAVKNARSQEALATGGVCVSGGVPYRLAVASGFWDSHHLLLSVPSPKLTETGIVYVFNMFGIHGDVLEHPISGLQWRRFSG